MSITITDLFCGAGGSSSGLATLPGVRVVMAANHWALAIESHQMNHPDTDHSNADISQVEPSWFPTTDILWASPECTNHSVAKGVKRQRALNDSLFELDGTRPLPDEAANRSRATMWDVPRFAEYHHYKAIIIENVVDAAKWVPFPAWLHTMELLGYEHEIVWLNSMHAQAYGLPAPQSRDRMYVVFWLKGNRAPDLVKWTRPQALCLAHGIIDAVQAFKKPTKWGRYRAQYLYRCPQCAAIVEPSWLPASSAIDFTIEGTRIGDREKPLSPKTMKRIEKGIERYWKPLIVEAAGNTYDSADPKHPQYGQDQAYLRAWPTDEVLRTLHTTSSKGVALPPLITDGIRGEGTVQSSADAMLTQTTAQTKGVVITLRGQNAPKSVTDPLDTFAANGNHLALLMRNNSSKGDGAEMVTPVTEVARTITTAGHQSLLVPYYSASESAKPVTEPHGTLTTTDRYGLVSPEVSVDVDDCIFRMLTPDEIKVGMAFERDYILLGTKREQVKQSGNAVTPPAAATSGLRSSNRWVSRLNP